MNLAPAAAGKNTKNAAAGIEQIFSHRTRYGGAGLISCCEKYSSQNHFLLWKRNPKRLPPFLKGDRGGFDKTVHISQTRGVRGYFPEARRDRNVSPEDQIIEKLTA